MNGNMSGASARYKDRLHDLVSMGYVYIQEQRLLTYSTSFVSFHEIPPPPARYVRKAILSIVPQLK